MLGLKDAKGKIKEQYVNIPDFKKFADLAKEYDLPLIVDNTFGAGGYLFRPFEHGANIVVESATKWIGGHGVAIGGIVVDGGTFDWARSDKFPTMTTPYAGYDGLVYAEEFGTIAFAQRARSEGLRDFGACLSPTNAFHLLQGVETLPLRMERHISNTAAVLAFLQKSEAVAWINHPSLPDHPDHALAQSLLPKGAGSIVSFGVKGGRAAGRKFIEALSLASHLANVGDAKTLVIHPASTTHRQMNAQQLERAGVSEDMIRLSVGLEAAGDIIGDLSQALRLSQKG